jgi:hypothetical protein
MKVSIEIHENGEEVRDKEEDFCPMISTVLDGLPPSLALSKCIRRSCKFWNKDKMECKLLEKAK